MPLERGKTQAVSHNIRELARAGHPHAQAVAAAVHAARRAHGGASPAKPHKSAPAPKVKAHWGPIHSHVAGRTDHLKMHVLSGSYVIPADIVSGMGEGNTMAGFKVAKSIFGRPVYGQAKVGAGAPYKHDGLPYGAPSVGKAEGGTVEDQYGLVPIVAAGGEFVIPPWDVEGHGDGDLDDGHQVLDHFVTKYRKKLVTTLKNLAGPKKN